MSARIAEGWISLDATPEQFGDAMALCQDGSASCVRTGKCSFEGDCFRSDKIATNQARNAIARAAEGQAPKVRQAMLLAADWLKIAAQDPRP